MVCLNATSIVRVQPPIRLGHVSKEGNMQWMQQEPQLDIVT